MCINCTDLSHRKKTYNNITENYKVSNDILSLGLARSLHFREVSGGIIYLYARGKFNTEVFGKIKRKFKKCVKNFDKEFYLASVDVCRQLQDQGVGDESNQETVVILSKIITICCHYLRDDQKQKAVNNIVEELEEPIYLYLNNKKNEKFSDIKT